MKKYIKGIHWFFKYKSTWLISRRDSYSYLSSNGMPMLSTQKKYIEPMADSVCGHVVRVWYFFIRRFLYHRLLRRNRID